MRVNKAHQKVENTNNLTSTMKSNEMKENEDSETT
jgi:hypothetical protein